MVQIGYYCLGQMGYYCLWFKWVITVFGSNGLLLSVVQMGYYCIWVQQTYCLRVRQVSTVSVVLYKAQTNKYYFLSEQLRVKSM